MRHLFEDAATTFMSSQISSSHLRKERRTFGLWQRECATLLGLNDPSALSRIERDLRLPSLETLIACVVLFRKPVEKLFPRLYADVEEQVMRKASELWSSLDDDQSLRAANVRKLLKQALNQAINRSHNHKNHEPLS